MRKQEEVFSEIRRNLVGDNIRKVVTMEIPSKKDKQNQRQQKKKIEQKFYNI